MRVLALRGVHVIMAVRNLSSGANVKELILKENPTAKIDVMELDLASFASVRKFASEFLSLNRPLNILMYDNFLRLAITLQLFRVLSNIDWFFSASPSDMFNTLFDLCLK